MERAWEGQGKSEHAYTTFVLVVAVIFAFIVFGSAYYLQKQSDEATKQNLLDSQHRIEAAETYFHSPNVLVKSSEWDYENSNVWSVKTEKGNYLVGFNADFTKVLSAVPDSK